METKINDVEKKESGKSMLLPLLQIGVAVIVIIVFWCFVFFHDSSPTQISETRELHSCFIAETRIGEFGYDVAFVLEEDIAEKGNDADWHRVRVKDFATFLDCVAHEGQEYAVWEITKTYDNGKKSRQWEFTKKEE